MAAMLALPGGPTPPQNNEAEMCAIGCMLLDERAGRFILRELDADMFYTPAHAVIFEAVRGLMDAGASVDIVTVRDILMFRGQLAEAGGVDYLVQILQAVPGTKGAGSYARIVRDKWAARRMMEKSAALARAAASGHSSPEELLVMASDLARGAQQPQGAVMELCDLPFDRSVSGVPTPWTKLNNCLRACNGWPMGQLSVIEAGMKVGKTTTLAQVALDHYEKGGRVMYNLFADLDHAGLAQRFVLHKTGFSKLPDDLAHQADYHGQIDQWKCAATDEYAGFGRMFVWDATKTPGGTRSSYARSFVRDFVEEHGITMVLNDYFQMIESDSRGQGMHSQMIEVANDMAHMARSCPGAATIIASQVTEKDGKVMARFSPELEANAGVVLRFSRDKEAEQQSTSRYVEAKMHVALNRFGSEGVVPLRYDRRNLAFLEA